MTTGLRAAAARASANDWDGALLNVTSAWAGTASPLVAALARRIAARIAPREVLLTGASQAAHSAWMEVASRRDPGDTARLFAALATTTAKQAKLRFRALANWRNPLLASALIELLRQAPWRTDNSLMMWTECVRLLSDSPDLGLAGDLRALASSFTAIIPTKVGATMQRRLHRVVSAWSSSMRPLEDDELRATCAEIEELLGPGSDRAAPLTEDELIAAIYNDPDDDEPRAVLADLLEERGDRRGAFISLQLAGTDLDSEHIAASDVSKWSGGLAPILSCAIYRRGFLAFARLGPSRKSFRFLAANPAWSTVEAIALPGAQLRERFFLPIADIAAQPQGRALDTLIFAYPELIAELSRSRGLGKLRRLLVDLPYARRSAVGAISLWLETATDARELGLNASEGGPRLVLRLLHDLLRAADGLERVTIVTTDALAVGELTLLLRVIRDRQIGGVRIWTKTRFAVDAELAGRGRVTRVRIRDGNVNPDAKYRRELATAVVRELDELNTVELDARRYHQPGSSDAGLAIPPSQKDLEAIATASGCKPVVLSGATWPPRMWPFR